MDELKTLLDDLKNSECKVTIGDSKEPIRNWFMLDGRVHLVTPETTLTFNKSEALKKLQGKIERGLISYPARKNGVNGTKPTGHTGTGVVCKATDYSVFNLHDKNRSVNPVHVKNLVQAIKKNDLLAGQPILVNEHMEVIDGQHRLEAAQQLGVPVYYIIRDGLTIEDAIDLNINTKNWGYADYLEYWISQGHEAYIYFKKFKDRYNFSWNVAINLLHHGKTGGGRSKDVFISGGLKTEHKAYAEHLGRITALLSRHSSFSNDRSLIRAIDSSIQAGYLDPFLLIKKVAMVPDKFTKCSDTESYLRMMEAVVNHYNKGERIRLF